MAPEGPRSHRICVNVRLDILVREEPSVTMSVAQEPATEEPIERWRQRRALRSLSVHELYVTDPGRPVLEVLRHGPEKTYVRPLGSDDPIGSSVNTSISPPTHKSIFVLPLALWRCPNCRSENPTGRSYCAYCDRKWPA